MTLPDGKTVFVVGSSIWIAGNAQEVPLDFKYSVNHKVALPSDLFLPSRIFDQGTRGSSHLIPARTGRETVKAWQEHLRNKALSDPELSEGLVIDQFQ